MHQQGGRRREGLALSCQWGAQPAWFHEDWCDPLTSPRDLSSQGAGSPHTSHPPVCPGHQVFLVKNDGSCVEKLPVQLWSWGVKASPYQCMPRPAGTSSPGCAGAARLGAATLLRSRVAEVGGGVRETQDRKHLPAVPLSMQAKWQGEDISVSGPYIPS